MPATPHSTLIDVMSRTAPVVGFQWDLRTNDLVWTGEPDTLRDWDLMPGVQQDGYALLNGIHPDDVLGVRRRLRELLQGGTECADLGHRRSHPDKEWLRVTCQARRVVDARGEPELVVGAFMLLPAQGAPPRIVPHRRDELTGLHTRSALVDGLSRMADRVAKLGACGGLLLIDLDRFRSINRSLGPKMGDALLCLAAERLLEVVPEPATLGRIGADQFGVVLGAESGADGTEKLADHIVEALARPVELGEHEVVVGVSVGLVLVDGRQSDPALILQAAENALARAKEGGGNRWSPYVAERAHTSERLSMEARLRHAIEDDALELHYQPIVRLPERTIASFEALIRWTDRDLGRVSPATFIPLAEESGQILAIGAWVLHQACRTLHNWRGHPLATDVRMNINLSALQFRQEDLVEQIDALLDTYPRARGYLNLELTETALLERPGDQVRVLERLRDLGCELHVDDFGTGWSSLSNLVRLPVDALKVDREFVGRADEDRKSLAVVRMVSRMAQEMGLSMTAEGIETEGQVQLLNALGRCKGQGYLFSRPLPETEAFASLSRGYGIDTTILRDAS